MSQKEKLIQKLKCSSSTVTFDDAETLLGYLGFEKYNKGRTSGSRVMFLDKSERTILLHNPHPQKELKQYQIKQLRDYLKREGLL